MKTKLLLVLFFSGFALLQAQIKVGVKVGVLATDVDFKAANSWQDLEVPTSRKLNYSGGVTFEYEFLKNLAGIRTGIEYSQKGYNVDLDKFKQLYDDIQHIDGDWSVALQYLQMPVNMYYKFGNFNINAGPYMAYALGGLEKYNLDILLEDGTSMVLEGTEEMTPVAGEIEASVEEGDATPLINYFNQLDLGINVGVGLNINNMQINIQYQQGLTNITPDLLNEPDFDPADLVSKNNVLSLELIYFFHVGKNK
jgi:hypothetical protein